MKHWQQQQPSPSRSSTTELDWYSHWQQLGQGAIVKCESYQLVGLQASGLLVWWCNIPQNLQLLANVVQETQGRTLVNCHTHVRVCNLTQQTKVKEYHVVWQAPLNKFPGSGKRDSADDHACEGEHLVPQMRPSHCKYTYSKISGIVYIYSCR